MVLVEEVIKMIDLTKPLRTRDGHSVEIYGVHDKSDWKFPVWGHISGEPNDQIRLWTRQGQFLAESRDLFRGNPYDLFNGTGN